MRSATHAANRAVHSNEHGRHAAPQPGELTLLAFWATLHFLAGCAFSVVLGLSVGTVFTDSQLVLHKGKVAYQKHYPGIVARQPHSLCSIGLEQIKRFIVRRSTKRLRG